MDYVSPLPDMRVGITRLHFDLLKDGKSIYVKSALFRRRARNRLMLQDVSVVAMIYS